MSIVRPEAAGARYLDALISLAAVARQLQSEAGDISLQAINRFLRSDAEFRAAYSGIQDDAQVLPAIVYAYLSERGVAGANLGQINTETQNVIAALDAWRVLVRNTLQGLSGAELIEATATNYNGTTLYQIDVPKVPAATADPSLRQSAELTALVTALTALGA